MPLPESLKQVITIVIAITAGTVERHWLRADKGAVECERVDLKLLEAVSQAVKFNSSPPPTCEAPIVNLTCPKLEQTVQQANCTCAPNLTCPAGDYESEAKERVALGAATGLGQLTVLAVYKGVQWLTQRRHGAPPVRARAPPRRGAGVVV